MSKRYKLFLGDCLEVLPKLNKGVRAWCHAVVTDIPYNISKENNFETMGRSGIDFGEWDHDFRCSDLITLPSYLKKDGSCFIFHSFEQYSDVREVMEKAGLVTKDRVIWEKTNPMPRNRDRRYISSCELSSWYTFPKAKWTFNRQDEKYQKMIFKFPTESGKRYHTTQKSLKLMEEIIKIHTNENDIVLDPYMGSGTTGVACMNLNRRFVGIEREEKYFNIARKRIEDAAETFNYKEK